jgi:hypothetical protein
MIHTKAEFKPKPTTDETAREVAVSDDQDIPLPDPDFLVLAVYLPYLLKACVDMSRKGERDEPLQS